MPKTGVEETPGAFASASDAEKSARLDASGRNEATPRPRSCVVCRSRKVRCDKRAPCSNCRRANIACVFPSTDRPPRWARRLDRLNSALSNPQASQEVRPIADGVMERLRTLECLVKDLSGQLEKAKSAAMEGRLVLARLRARCMIENPGNSHMHYPIAQEICSRNSEGWYSGMLVEAAISVVASGPGSMTRLVWFALPRLMDGELIFSLYRSMA